jgi:hypothetical protein
MKKISWGFCKSGINFSVFLITYKLDPQIDNFIWLFIYDTVATEMVIMLEIPMSIMMLKLSLTISET